MSLSFVILAGVIVGSALGALFFRNPVHCALSLALTFSGLAGIFLQLGAEFVGFTQILVYVGAVAVLIVFAILLTRSSEVDARGTFGSTGWMLGIGVSAVTFLSMIKAIWSSRVLHGAVPGEPALKIKAIGERLLDQYVVPLEVMALLLTAAMIGAALIAMQDRGGRERKEGNPT